LIETCLYIDSIYVLVLRILNNFGRFANEESLQSASDLAFNQLLPTKLFITKVAMKTAQVLKITSAWSLLILEDRKLFIEAKVNHEAQCIRNLKLNYIGFFCC
jgi:hypothetical protein